MKSFDRTQAFLTRTNHKTSTPKAETRRARAPGVLPPVPVGIIFVFGLSAPFCEFLDGALTWMLQAERFSSTSRTFEEMSDGTPLAISQIAPRVLAELNHLCFTAKLTLEDKRPFSNLEITPSCKLTPCVPRQVNKG